MKPKIYCDLDGVLADLDRHYMETFGIAAPHIEHADKEWDTIDWKRVQDSRGFFANIPPMPDMHVLWEYIAPYKPVILTGVPVSVSEAADNKREWCARHLGPDVEVRCVLSREKYLHCRPWAILIDDWEKYREKWINAGGVWITHTSAEKTIDALESLLRSGVYGIDFCRL